MAWYRRFVNLTRSDQLSRELDREFAHHMAERRDELMKSGMNARDAEAGARRKFGNATLQKERTRDVNLIAWLETCVADIRHAFRALRRSPAFALVAILSLGLGIGANTAIFSLINAVMLKSLPVQHPEQLAAVAMGDFFADHNFSNPLWEQVRDHQDMFAGAFATAETRFDLTTGGETRRAIGAYVSGDYFSVLGVRASVGRMFVRSDDVRGCPAIAVLSEPFWQSEFGGDPRAVGKRIMLGGHPFEIVGVADASFFGMQVGMSTQVYAPLCAQAVVSGSNAGLDERDNWWIRVTARLRPGMAPGELRGRLNALAPAAFQATVPARYSEKDQAHYQRTTLVVEPQPGGPSGLRDRYKSSLYTLMVVVGVVLLIACGNVANLLLARARVREREAAVRLAIGAGRGRLVRQLLTESLVLAAIGAGTGVLFAQWGTRLLVSLLSRSTSAVWLDLSVDWRMLAFTGAVAVLTGVVFGIVPALRAAGVSPQSVMRGGGRGITDERRRFPLAKTLVVGQVALSLTLLIAAGLLLGSFRRLTAIDLGFRSENVLVVNADISRAGLAEDARSGMYQFLMERLQAVPGVRSVAQGIVPMNGLLSNGELVVDGFVPSSPRDAVVWMNSISPGYFEAMGMPMVSGRTFGPADRLATQPVAIVNESVARKFFPGRDAVGQLYHTMDGDKAGPNVQIVGIVRDSKYESVTEGHSETVFLAASQDEHPGNGTAFAIRASGPPSALIPAVRSAISQVNTTITFNFKTLDGIVSESLTRPRLLARLSVFFGALALLLAIVGLYGTMAYTVERRRNEIGIRIALGAARPRVLAMVLGEAGWMVFGGIVVGVAIAVGATRWVSSLLYGLKPTDTMTYLLSGAVLAVVALAASAVPAWRAARLDPMDALREE
jgi:predicted permease